MFASMTVTVLNFYQKCLKYDTCMYITLKKGEGSNVLKHAVLVCLSTAIRWRTCEVKNYYLNYANYMLFKHSQPRDLSVNHIPIKYSWILTDSKTSTSKCFKKIKQIKTKNYVLKFTEN